MIFSRDAWPPHTAQAPMSAPKAVGRADVTIQVRKRDGFGAAMAGRLPVSSRSGQNAARAKNDVSYSVAAVEERTRYRMIQTTIPQTMMLMGHANTTPFSSDDRQRRGRVRARSIGPARGDASIMAALMR